MSSKEIYKILFLVISSLCYCFCFAQAYSFQGVVHPTVTVRKVINLTITSNASSAINFNSSSNFSDGISIPNFATVKIKSNVAWAFGVSTTTPFFSASGPYASTDMPAQVLGMRLGSQTQYQSLTTTSKILASGSRGDEQAAGNSFNLSLHADPKYDYGPGIYTITINYTLTAP